MRRVEEVWGTAIGVEIRDDADGALEAVDAVYEWFGRVDDLFSTWHADTEISQIGAGALAVDDASAEVREVLVACEALRVETDGAFDVTVASRVTGSLQKGQGPLDPSGFVKGWALERAATMLLMAGARSFSINAGGDVLVRGGGWRIGVQHPRERDRVAAVLEVDSVGVATSGTYERGAHVLDPRTAAPVTALLSATVVGDDLGIADAWATALIVLGVDGLARLAASRPGYDAMVITAEDHVVLTDGFAALRAPT